MSEAPQVSYGRLIADGLLTRNPSFIQLLGMCPTLAVSTRLKNGLGMGLATSAVLVCSNVIISALRRHIPEEIRIAAYVVLIAGLTTAVDYTLKAFLPELSVSLGIFIPLIVVNCIILARAESFASKNNAAASAVDGISMGLGFTLSLCVLSAIREIIGNGTLWDMPLFGSAYQPFVVFSLPPGGFLVFGVLIAAVQFITRKLGRKGEA